MDRRNFFKWLGIGTVAVATPTILPADSLLESQMKVSDLIRELQKLPQDADVESRVRVIGSLFELRGQGPVKTIFYDSARKTAVINGKLIVAVQPS